MHVPKPYGPWEKELAKINVTQDECMELLKPVIGRIESGVLFTVPHSPGSHKRYRMQWKENRFISPDSLCWSCDDFWRMLTSCTSLHSMVYDMFSKAIDSASYGNSDRITQELIVFV